MIMNKKTNVKAPEITKPETLLKSDVLKSDSCQIQYAIPNMNIIITKIFNLFINFNTL